MSREQELEKSLKFIKGWLSGIDDQDLTTAERNIKKEIEKVDTEDTTEKPASESKATNVYRVFYYNSYDGMDDFGSMTTDELRSFIDPKKRSLGCSYNFNDLLIMLNGQDIDTEAEIV